MTTEVDRPTAEIGSEPPSDAELIIAVRDGSTGAYAMLHDRHLHAALRLAGTLTADPDDADDLVAATFAGILDALRDGHGPDLAFRTYLHTTLRDTFTDLAPAAGPAAAEHASDEAGEVETSGEEIAEEESGDDAGDQIDASAVRTFQELPERWQVVLWHTEVEDDPPAAIAPLLGLTPSGVAALARRARERFCEVYLPHHTAEVTEPDDLARLLAPAVLGATWEAYLEQPDPAPRPGVLATLAAMPGTAARRAREATHGVREAVRGVRGTTPGVREATRRVREATRRLGARNGAIAAGVVAAVVVAALATTLLVWAPAPPPVRPEPPAAGPEEPTEAPTSRPPSPTPSAVPSSPSAAPTGQRRSGRPAAPPHRPKPGRPSPSGGDGQLPLPPVIITPDPGRSMFTGRFGGPRSHRAAQHSRRRR